MTELKPCPFCGGTEIKMYSLGTSDLHGFSHLCKINGEVMVKVESRFFNTEEEAAEVWNRRAVNVPDTNVGDISSRKIAKDTNVLSNDCISRQAAIDEMNGLPKWIDSDHGVCLDYSDVICVLGDTEKLQSAQPGLKYTKEELDVLRHGISLSLLSKRSSQHWKYDEDTAKEIEFLEKLYKKVVADMRGEHDE